GHVVLLRITHIIRHRGVQIRLGPVVLGDGGPERAAKTFTDGRSVHASSPGEGRRGGRPCARTSVRTAPCLIRAAQRRLAYVSPTIHRLASSRPPRHRTSGS